MWDGDNIRRLMASGEWIGWMATACFTLSYLVRRERNLFVVQAVASSMWLVYGLIIHATPMVVANAIVAGAAATKAVRVTRQSRARARI